MELNYKEVEEFYSDLLDTKTPKAQKYLVYKTYAEAKEEQENLQEVISFFEKKSPVMRGISRIAHKISNELFIIETASVNGSSLYFPIVWINNAYHICEDARNYFFSAFCFLDAVLYGIIYLSNSNGGEEVEKKFDFVKKYLYYASLPDFKENN